MLGRSTLRAAPRRRLWLWTAGMAMALLMFLLLRYSFAATRRGVSAGQVLRQPLASAALPAAEQSAREQSWRSALRNEASALTRNLHRSAQQRSDVLYVAMVHMWFEDAGMVMAELAILKTVLEEGLGAPVEPAPSSMNWQQQMEAADILLTGPYAQPSDVASMLEKQQALRASSGRPPALVIFIAPENTDGRGDFEHQLTTMAGIHVSLGLQRRASFPMTNYLRLPWWLPYTVDPAQRCAFPPSLTRSAPPEEAAAAWRARPGFATMLSKHYNYPRPELYHLLNSSGYGRVDAPSKAFHNMEWPADLPNSHLTGKLPFLQRYRFNICPENSRTQSRGYNTEKVPQALMSGSVPVYWGDAPIDPDVFNQARIITYMDGDNSSVAHVLHRLESERAEAVSRGDLSWFGRPPHGPDPGCTAAPGSSCDSFTLHFFSQPVLAPSAELWLTRWCDDAAALLAKAWARLHAPGQRAGATADAYSRDGALQVW